MASAPSGARPASSSGRRPNDAWRRVTRSAYGFRRAVARERAAGSRSIPSNVVPGAAANNAAACPPRPMVASTRQAPGRGRSHSTTPPNITGTWAAPAGPMSVSVVIGGASHPWSPALAAAFTRAPHFRPPAASHRVITVASEIDVAPSTWTVEERLLVGGEDLLPRILVPDAKFVYIAREHHIPSEPCIFAQELREENPALAVDHALVCARHVVVPELRDRRVEALLLEQARFERLPGCEGIHIKAPAPPQRELGDDETLFLEPGERLAEPSGDGHPSLVVHRMRVVPAEHPPHPSGSSSHPSACSTTPHIHPPSATCPHWGGALTHIQSDCQEVAPLGAVPEDGGPSLGSAGGGL